MADQLDDKFYERADAHIHLSNDQLSGMSAGKVSASMMYATARFNAWISASGFGSGAEMAAKRDETVDYFVTGYRQMLEANLDEYIKSFDGYMKRKPDTAAGEP
jgi:hypothetical protein